MSNAPLHRVSWACGALGVVVAVINSLTDSDALASGTYLTSTVLLGVALIIAALVNKPDNRIWPMLLLIAGTSITGQVIDARFTDQAPEQAIAEGLFLVVQLLLAVGLTYISAKRLGNDPISVVVDGIIVGLGAWFLIWVGLLKPIIDTTEQTIVVNALQGATLAASAIVLFTLATLFFGDSLRTPAVWLVAAAITFTLIGDVIYSAIDAGRIDASSNHALSAYIASLLFAAAAFLHPSIRTLTKKSIERQQRPLLSRLIVTTSALTVPVIVLASSDPVDTADRVVRAVSIAVLTIAVTARVVQAVVSNAKIQKQLIASAQTDALTGLPSRSLMLTHVNNTLLGAYDEGRQPSVLFIDVDRFKNINDSLGHQAGDDVLVAVAQRLRNALPPHCVVGRISGDEFVVLDSETRSPSEAMLIADKILDCFHEPLSLRQGDVFVSASVGVATYQPTISGNADDLLRHADTAMYRAKDAGRNCVAVFDESMLERVTQRLAVETALYRALERRELRLVHQPIVDIEDGEVVGFEALMRWQRDDGSMISPAEFIPIAEETGTIVPIGAWALLEALTHLKTWITEGVCRSDATMSVNVSPRQLHDPQFVSVVAEALRRSRVTPDQLWLEVTESVMIAEPDQALSALNRLCDIGVRVAIDDFGTGYSSLSLLQKFPIQRLKIDRSFINGVSDDLSARSLVRTIIAMGDSLGLDMVAEGVESVRQLQTLAELRCAKAQGYLISHPVPPESMGSTVAALDQFGSWSRLRGPRNT
ncbi:MAG: putative bifunctional diguanylate cyclase/phosphodiesterase [Ilumatobacteraceae bacterium]